MESVSRDLTSQPNSSVQQTLNSRQTNPLPIEFYECKDAKLLATIAILCFAVVLPSFWFIIWLITVQKYRE